MLQMLYATVNCMLQLLLCATVTVSLGRDRIVNLYQLNAQCIKYRPILYKYDSPFKIVNNLVFILVYDTH